MSALIGFEKGIGIGGWLTNYKRFAVIPKDKIYDITVGDLEHFEDYITVKDVIYIASLGADHIRLCFDQVVLEEKPFVYRERIFALIANFVAWCEKYSLNVVFNLHKAIGNYCDVSEEVTLFESDALCDRFVALWTELEKRFSDKPFVAFELLNEVRDVEPDGWNNLAERTVNAIRELNSERKIFIGGTHWGAVDRVDSIKIFDDPNVFYTFHFYKPFEFTHQQGVLQTNTMYYNRRMEYPAPVDKYVDYRKCIGSDPAIYDGFEFIDKEYLRAQLLPALEFKKAHPDKVLACTEFGTIRHCISRYRENWMGDLVSLFREYDIPYSAWNYCSAPYDGNKFSLVDEDSRRILSRQLAKAIFPK